ncbi:hypothetical protein BR93DRAFT_192469 [Coniochaeta sp. PMI_546]|nr:hypothetical protein BR93DRAFT_192469 [Coniochaeta sp. PMI_546]
MLPRDGRTTRCCFRGFNLPTAMAVNLAFTVLQASSIVCILSVGSASFCSRTLAEMADTIFGFPPLSYNQVAAGVTCGILHSLYLYRRHHCVLLERCTSCVPQVLKTIFSTMLGVRCVGGFGAVGRAGVLITEYQGLYLHRHVVIAAVRPRWTHRMF